MGEIAKEGRENRQREAEKVGEGETTTATKSGEAAAQRGGAAARRPATKEERQPHEDPQRRRGTKRQEGKRSGEQTATQTDHTQTATAKGERGQEGPHRHSNRASRKAIGDREGRGVRRRRREGEKGHTAI
jgi:hypothetical protein